MPPADEIHPGDDAAPDTPGTGQLSCPRCSGTGKLTSGECPDCLGSGKVVQAIN